MTDSRTLVYQTLQKEGPERVPRHVWDIRWTYDHFPLEMKRLREAYPDDIVWCPQFLRRDSGCEGDPYAIGTYTDEWGCVFENKFEGIIGEVKNAQIISDECEGCGHQSAGRAAGPGCGSGQCILPEYRTIRSGGLICANF